jgi:hypothetical protein
MMPRRDRVWFSRKVRELGEALAALTPARRELAHAQLLDASARREAQPPPFPPPDEQSPGA